MQGIPGYEPEPASPPLSATSWGDGPLKYPWVRESAAGRDPWDPRRVSRKRWARLLYVRTYLGTIRTMVHVYVHTWFSVHMCALFQSESSDITL
jgi:hypothetical protein